MTEGAETPGAIWDKLSHDAREICMFLGDHAEDQRLVREVFEEKGDMDVDRVLQELQAVGVLEETTYAQEMPRMLERLKPDRDLGDWRQLKDRPLSDDERLYLRTKDNWRYYQLNPTEYAGGREPEWRLSDDFGEFAAQKARIARQEFHAARRREEIPPKGSFMERLTGHRKK